MPCSAVFIIYSPMVAGSRVATEVLLGQNVNAPMLPVTMRRASRNKE